MDLLEIESRAENLKLTIVNTNKIRCLALVTILVLCATARALDPNQPANSFLRKHFTTDDGLPGIVAGHVVQTNDGFLWVVTNNSFLNRFDGKTFTGFKNPRASVLAVAPDGALWIGTDEGLIRVPSSSFNQFKLDGLTEYQPDPGKATKISSLLFSRNGVLWVGTAAGLFRYERDQFVAVGPRVPTSQIHEAPDGHLLVVNDEGVIEIAGSEVVPHPGLVDQLGEKLIFDVLRDRRGNTWYCTAAGVMRETNGRIEKLDVSPGNSPRLIHEDPHGTVWIGKEKGLLRATSAGLELVDKDIQVRSLYTDRDGNLWVGTNGDGLYRFKDRAIRMFTTADGLPNDVIMTVITAHDGAIWTGANCGGITRFDGKNFKTYSEKDGLRNSCVWSLVEDMNRDLWIGTYGGGAFRFHDGAFTQYSKSQGLADDIVAHVYAARDGSVWFSTPNGLSRLKNGQIRNFTTADGLTTNTIATVFEDRAGTIWVGNRLGLDRMVGDRFESFAPVSKTTALAFAEDREGGLYVNVLVGPNAVTRRFYKDRVDTIQQMSAYDLIETEQGELWFGSTPLSRVQPGNFTHPRTPDEPLDFEAFSTEDGLITAGTSSWSRTLALGRDGKMYAATPKGLAALDLNLLRVTHTKPTIYLTDITIGRNTERAGREIVIPAGTSHVKIQFAAVEISAPEKIRLQYRLDGVDSEWLDAPNDSSAIYTSIPVGTHALRIRACNRNGIWDRQGMVFMITQRPFFYQTRWFIAAVSAAGILLVFLIYRLRVAQISRQMSARFDERLAERTRVARELHDTLLQTVQGSKMVADHALKNPTDQTRMLRAMEQLSTWLAQATQEGRAALLSLRGSTTEKNDLEEAFRRAIDECGRDSKVEISFSVTGDAREMHPVVRDEVYRIGYEAIRNACTHSGAERLAITLEYAHDLTLLISDNGVGIDSEIIEQGKDGHFGLRGMKERADRIDSKLTLSSSSDSGTTITLVVPGRLAFTHK